MAPTGGFEPPRRFHDLSVFKTDPFSHLGTWAYIVPIVRLGNGFGVFLLDVNNRADEEIAVHDSAIFNPRERPKPRQSDIQLGDGSAT